MLRFWRATINTRNGLAFAIRSEQAIELAFLLAELLKKERLGKGLPLPAAAGL